MTEIIITIKPHHLRNIRNGTKTFEIRKTEPRCDLPFKVYCCESKSGGNILAEFVCDRIENKCDMTKCCVSAHDFREYANNGKVFFWHISDMYDYTCTSGYAVRNISEFGLKRPPQSWCYTKEERTSHDI